MTDDPRVEAVARELCHKDEQDGGPPWAWYPETTKHGMSKEAYRERALAALAAADKAAWRQISEYDPVKHGEVVDLWVNGRRWTNMEWSPTSPVNPGGAWKRDGDDWWQELSTLNPTHFMSLPSPPSDD